MSVEDSLPMANTTFEVLDKEALKKIETRVEFISYLKATFVSLESLPICYKFNNISQNDAHNIMSEMATVFQMSDCDIG